MSPPITSVVRDFINYSPVAFLHRSRRNALPTNAGHIKTPAEGDTGQSFHLRDCEETKPQRSARSRPKSDSPTPKLSYGSFTNDLGGDPNIRRRRIVARLPR